MISRILSDIICSTYMGEVHTFRSDAEWKRNTKAMAFSFLLYDGTGERQTLHVIIRGEQNYIGVYTALTDDQQFPTDLSTFECISYHDTCWRFDGIDRLLWKHAAKINVIVRSKLFNTRWYDVLDLDDDKLATLHKLRKR